jgi:hypothetical protein
MTCGYEGISEEKIPNPQHQILNNIGIKKSQVDGLE